MDYGIVFEAGFWAAAGMMTGALATLSCAAIGCVAAASVCEVLPRLSPARLVARWRA